MIFKGGFRGPRVALGDGTIALTRPQRLHARAERLAVAAAQSPLRSLGWLLLLNATAAVVFLAAGVAIFDDEAEFFRELMPATFLSCAELLFIAVIAWAIHERQATGTGWRRYDNFWALSAGVFLLLAIDEITQATVFLADLLQHYGDVSPAGGFRDLDAVLIVALLLICALVLARRAEALFRYPLAIALLGVGVLLGACSQTLDSFWKATSGEFAAEESFKLMAEPFLIAGYLVVLNAVLRRKQPDDGTASPRTTSP